MTPSLSTQPNPPARGSRAVCGIDARTCESGVGGKFSPRFNPAQPTSCCLTSRWPERCACACEQGLEDRSHVGAR